MKLGDRIKRYEAVSHYTATGRGPLLIHAGKSRAWLGSRDVADFAAAGEQVDDDLAAAAGYRLEAE